MPARGVVLDLWDHEYARRHLARAGPSDWPDVGRAAWGDLVHHAPARDAVHGRLRAGAVWAYLRRGWGAFRRAQRADGRDGMCGADGEVRCAVRSSASA